MFLVMSITIFGYSPRFYLYRDKMFGSSRILSRFFSWGSGQGEADAGSQALVEGEVDDEDAHRFEVARGCEVSAVYGEEADVGGEACDGLFSVVVVAGDKGGELVVVDMAGALIVGEDGVEGFDNVCFWELALDFFGAGGGAADGEVSFWCEDVGDVDEGFINEFGAGFAENVWDGGVGDGEDDDVAVGGGFGGGFGGVLAAVSNLVACVFEAGSEGGADVAVADDSYFHNGKSARGLV